MKPNNLNSSTPTNNLYRPPNLRRQEGNPPTPNPVNSTTTSAAADHGTSRAANSTYPARPNPQPTYHPAPTARNTAYPQPYNMGNITASPYGVPGCYGLPYAASSAHSAFPITPMPYPYWQMPIPSSIPPPPPPASSTHAHFSTASSASSQQNQPFTPGTYPQPQSTANFSSPYFPAPAPTTTSLPPATPPVSAAPTAVPLEGSSRLPKYLQPTPEVPQEPEAEAKLQAKATKKHHKQAKAKPQPKPQTQLPAPPAPTTISQASQISPSSETTAMTPIAQPLSCTTSNTQGEASASSSVTPAPLPLTATSARSTQTNHTPEVPPETPSASSTSTSSTNIQSALPNPSTTTPNSSSTINAQNSTPLQQCPISAWINSAITNNRLEFTNKQTWLINKLKDETAETKDLRNFIKELLFVKHKGLSLSTEEQINQPNISLDIRRLVEILLSIERYFHFASPLGQEIEEDKYQSVTIDKLTKFFTITQDLCKHFLDNFEMMHNWLRELTHITPALREKFAQEIIIYLQNLNHIKQNTQEWLTIDLRKISLSERQKYAEKLKECLNRLGVQEPNIAKYLCLDLDKSLPKERKKCTESYQKYANLLTKDAHEQLDEVQRFCSRATDPDILRFVIMNIRSDENRLFLWQKFNALLKGDFLKLAFLPKFFETDLDQPKIYRPIDRLIFCTTHDFFKERGLRILLNGAWIQYRYQDSLKPSEIIPTFGQGFSHTVLWSVLNEYLDKARK